MLYIILFDFYSLLNLSSLYGCKVLKFENHLKVVLIFQEQKNFMVYKKALLVLY